MKKNIFEGSSHKIVKTRRTYFQNIDVRIMIGSHFVINNIPLKINTIIQTV